MSFRVDPPVSLNGHHFAVISDVHVRATEWGRCVAAHGAKTPRLLVIFDGEDMQVLPVGAKSAPAEAENLIPEAQAALRKTAAAKGTS